MLDRHPLLSLSAIALLTVPVVAQKDGSPAEQQRAQFYASSAWTEFLAQTGGQWRVEWSDATGSPRAIWGSGLALADWRENTLVEARRHANQLLSDRRELLALGDSEFRETIGSRMGRTWVLVYDQYFHGVPVIGGRADVRVNMTGRVPMFGSTAWQIPANFGTTPAIAAETAQAIAWQALGQMPTGVSQPAPVAAPRLVIWGDIESHVPTTPSLAWEVAVSNVDAEGQGPIGRYYVDARTGAVLHYTTDKHECGIPGCTIDAHRKHAAAEDVAAATMLPPVNTTVTVMGWTRTGNDGFSALVNVPLPGLQLNVPGVGAVTTDANGQFTVNIASPVSISVGALDGRHHNPILGGSAPSGSFTVNPGVNSTIQLLTSGATQPQAAHTTTSWWVDKTNEYLRAILGNTSQLATADAVVPTVNIASTCNAYYTGNTINFYAAGGGCNNTAFSTVVSHEWGHGLDERYGGISQINGLSEGWGDIVALYIVDSPVLGSGFQTAGIGIRDGNNTRQYPTGSGVHAQGESWMGFAWNLRDRLAQTYGNRPQAITVSNDIVLGSIVANAVDQPGAVLEVFLADDNDGNLTNGTPNSVDLIWACNQHSLPYPGQPSQVPNDDCATAIAVVDGINGPYTNVGAFTSSSWPCASGASDVWFSYTTASSGTLTVQTCNQAAFDTAIEVFSGACGSLTSLGCNDDSCSLQSLVAVPIGPGTYYIRVGGYSGAQGPFSLDVQGPGSTGVPATATAYGTGCYAGSKAFYELFAPNGFDLSGSSMLLVANAGAYTAVPGGSYVAPSGSAQSLGLLDDSTATVTLASAFPTQSGPTNTLEVCSNGFVSVANGSTAYTPSASGWLASATPTWGTWHDFNPSAAGSGAVKFEQIGSVAYITWDGVYSYNTTTPNTWQLQFDTATGNVTYAWQSVTSSGNAWLVGYAGAAPNTDRGSIDISVLLPGGFSTSATNSLPLSHASTLPHLGGTATLTTSQFPASSLLGLQLLSTIKHDPGIDLAIIGMPGCRLYAEPTVMNVLLPVSQQATYGLAIPNNPALIGVEVVGQGVAFSAGANAAGLISSNGMSLVIGN